MAQLDDSAWMSRAVDYSGRCPRSFRSFSVGALIVVRGQEVSFGFSRETESRIHAEESALAKAGAADLSEATMYSTLEPCSERLAHRPTCTQLILDSGIRRVVYAYREPPIFVTAEGIERLQAAGVTVVVTPQWASAVIRVNAHLLAGHAADPS